MSGEMRDPARVDDSGAPLPNRLTRGTLLGCVGIACVFVLPVLLLLPFTEWDVPTPLHLFILLAAFCALFGGAWLVARVPAGVPGWRSPLRPLTHEGQAPLVERPARAEHRAMLAGLCALLAVEVSGYLLIGFAPLQSHGEVVGLLLCVAAGLALLTASALVLAGKAPPPAWRWVRGRLYGPALGLLAPFLFAGGVGLSWALLTALYSGYPAGGAGLALLVLAAVLAAPLVRRWPPRDHS